MRTRVQWAPASLVTKSCAAPAASVVMAYSQSLRNESWSGLPVRAGTANEIRLPMFGLVVGPTIEFVGGRLVVICTPLNGSMEKSRIRGLFTPPAMRSRLDAAGAESVLYTPGPPGFVVVRNAAYSCC